MFSCRSSKWSTCSSCWVHLLANSWHIFEPWSSLAKHVAGYSSTMFCQALRAEHPCCRCLMNLLADRQIPTDTVNIQSAVQATMMGLYLKQVGLELPKAGFRPSWFEFYPQLWVAAGTISGKFPATTFPLPGCVSCRLHLTNVAGKLSKATW